MGKNDGIVQIDGKAKNPNWEVFGTAEDLIVDGNGNPAKWLCGWRKSWTDLDSAFLVGRGWSASREAWQRATDSGIPIMAINDVPDSFAPRMWCTGDPPNLFKRSIWENPAIAKFSPLQHAKQKLSQAHAYEKPRRSVDCPNVHFFNKDFNHNPYQFFETPWLSWGTMWFGKNTPYCADKIGARSSMIAGLRLLWHFGFRNVFLLGCDFTPHEYRTPLYYEDLSRQLKELRGVFDQYGYHVYQTNPDSHLRVFDYLPLEQALVPQAAGTEVVQPKIDRLAGMAYAPPAKPQKPAPAYTPVKRHKLYIVTLDTGKFMHPNVEASQRAYAKRCGAEYIVVRKFIGKYRNPYATKLNLDRVKGIVEPARVLWLDGDMVISDQCESVFDLVPAGHFGAVPNNQPHSQTAEALKLASHSLETISEMAKVERPDIDDVYFNGGLMLFELPYHRAMWEWMRKTAVYRKKVGPLEEQTLENIAVADMGYPLTLLPITYNRIGESVWRAGPMVEKVQHLARIGKMRTGRDELFGTIWWRMSQYKKAMEKAHGQDRV
jgi:heat shock protein HspQ